MGCKIANDSGWLNNKRDDNCPLKEQEPVKPTWSQGKAYCGICGQRLPRKRADNCGYCGQAVKWE